MKKFKCCQIKNQQELVFIDLIFRFITLQTLFYIGTVKIRRARYSFDTDSDILRIKQSSFTFLMQMLAYLKIRHLQLLHMEHWQIHAILLYNMFVLIKLNLNNSWSIQLECGLVSCEISKVRAPA